MVFTRPPKGWEKPGWVWRMKRKLNGRGDGSQSFAEWLSFQILQMGARRSVLHPSTFILEYCGKHVWISGHVDDVIMVGETSKLDDIQAKLAEVVLLTVTGSMKPHESSERYSFLGRERR